MSNQQTYINLGYYLSHAGPWCDHYSITTPTFFFTQDAKHPLLLEPDCIDKITNVGAATDWLGQKLDAGFKFPYVFTVFEVALEFVKNFCSKQHQWQIVSPSIPAQFAAPSLAAIEELYPQTKPALYSMLQTQQPLHPAMQPLGFDILSFDIFCWESYLYRRVLPEKPILLELNQHQLIDSYADAVRLTRTIINREIGWDGFPISIGNWVPCLIQSFVVE
ncbi:hypothetical protein [Herpetosiphon llansteffanensis]|uniref:hypothetical protein n=1 Tax=Herpetosiphon llansteffanensis TaxID=2094568 RepID=UPI000D7C46ED|nr:hypothetical protein [Herpetosiphon llansteffanensis]